MTFKLNLLNRRLEAKESEALPPQDLNRWRRTTRGVAAAPDRTRNSKKKKAVCVYLTNNGAVARTQLDSSLLSDVFLYFTDPDSAGKMVLSVSKQWEFRS